MLPLELICRSFGLGEPLSPPVLVSGGVEKALVWKLSTSQGEWAIKRVDLQQGLPRLEQRVRFEREGWEAGLPLPQPRLTEKGAGLLLAGRHAIGAREWCGWERVSWARPPAEVLLRLVEALARLHQGEWAHPIPLSRWWLQRERAGGWPELLRHAQLQGRPWAEGLRAALPRLEWADALIEASQPSLQQGMCHLDANPHNLLTNGSQIMLLDWDGCGLACPSGELASVLANWACDGEGLARGELPAQAVRAYRQAGGLFHCAGPEVFRQHLIGWLNWMEERIGLALNPAPGQTAELDQTVEGLLLWSGRLEGLPALAELLRRL